MNTIVMLALLLAADPIQSGPQPGQKPGPYAFLIATGPQRGQPTCYVCDTGDKPMAIVFAKELTPALGKLTQKLDKILTTKSDARGWLTLTAKGEGHEEKLVAWSRPQGLRQLPLGVFDDADGPPAYKLAKSAVVTVVVAVEKKVVASFAFRDGELTEAKIDEVVAAFTKVQK